MLDQTGKEVKVGDTVNLPVKITEQYGGADFTKIEVETVHVQPPHYRRDRFLVNSAQVEAKEK